MDLTTITHEDFQRCLRQNFNVKFRDAESVFDLELIEVEAVGAENDFRRPFSVLFRGPLEPVLGQSSYLLANDALGELVIFLVPIGPDAYGMRYEANFT